MPTIATITSIKPTGDNFETPNGVYWPYKVILSDGTTGEASSKTQYPKYQVGEEIEYEIVRTIKGLNKLKIGKPGGFVPRAKAPVPTPAKDPFNPPTTNSIIANKFNSDGMERGMCLKIAADLVAQNHRETKILVDKTTICEELVDMAEQILAANNKMKVFNVDPKA